MLRQNGVWLRDFCDFLMYLHICNVCNFRESIHANNYRTKVLDTLVSVKATLRHIL